MFDELSMADIERQIDGIQDIESLIERIGPPDDDCQYPDGDGPNLSITQYMFSKQWEPLTLVVHVFGDGKLRFGVLSDE